MEKFSDDNSDNNDDYIYKTNESVDNIKSEYLEEIDTIKE